MAIDVIDGFKVNAPVPPDVRQNVQTIVQRDALSFKYHGMEVFVRDDNASYVLASDLSTWSLSSSGGSSSGGGFGVWTYNNLTSVPPTSGEFRFNNSNILSSNRINISNTDSDTTDKLVILSSIPGVDKYFYLSKVGDPTTYILFRASTSQPKSGYFRFNAREITVVGSISNGDTFNLNFATPNEFDKVLMVFDVKESKLPTVSPALLSTVNSTNPTDVLVMDDVSKKFAIFEGYLKNYTGGGLQFNIFMSTVSNDPSSFVEFEGSIQDLSLGTNMSNDNSFSPIKIASNSVNSANELNKISFTFLSTEIDGLVNGNLFKFMFNRNVGSINDEISGDYHIHKVVVSEVPV